jgi:hypothetical protein
MKLAIVAFITAAATGGALAMPTSVSWEPIGAQPEALLTGAGLLVLASLLRRGVAAKKVR